jgi:hypothetical protein
MQGQVYIYFNKFVTCVPKELKLFKNGATPLI